jgi:hypothetical protein
MVGPVVSWESSRRLEALTHTRMLATVLQYWCVRSSVNLAETAWVPHARTLRCCGLAVVLELASN